MKKKNKIIYPILALTIPIVIVILSMFLTKIYPFGERILLKIDGYSQYPGFLNSFFEVIKGHASIFYSFKGFLGINSLANFVYYTLNITNIFYLLFNNDVLNFYTFIIPLKIGLCSLTMYFFLNYLKPNKNNLIFSLCYGLSIYNLTYYLNYMWFDSIILLPLVILGIEKIFKENKSNTYILTLSLAIICNFYIGYMICIFSVIYFIYKSITDKFNKTILKKYLIASLLSGLISAVFVIPVGLELANGKADLFSEYVKDYFQFDLDFLNVFYKLTFGSYCNGDMEYGNPNLYVTLFIYLNLIMFFFNKKITLKERIVSLIIFLFFLLSMSFNLLDYFWHMMQMPIFYPVRYGFIFDFFIIYLAYKNFTNYEKKDLLFLLIPIIIIIILSTIGLFTSEALTDKENIITKIIFITISLIFTIYYAFIMNNKSLHKYLIFIIILELTLSTFTEFRKEDSTLNKTDFKEKYNLNTQALDTINPKYFDRIIFETDTIKNNGLLLNYNDINFFSSIRNKNSLEVLNKLFNINILNDCNAHYFFDNPITNAMLNIKYYIADNNIDYYEEIDNNIYLNKDATYAFMTSKEILNLKLTDNYQNNINELIKIINNNDNNIIKEIPVKDTNISCNDICIINGGNAYLKYEFKSDNKYFMFIHLNKAGSDKAEYEIMINDKKYHNIKNPYLINNNDNISIYIDAKNKDNLYDYHLYLIDYGEYQKLINNMKTDIKVQEYKSDSNFTLTINNNKDGLLFTSISNDKGWKVYVDGNPTPIESIYDGLLGINLTKGNHTIKFTYITPGFKEGLIISIISLITSFIIIKKEKNY